MPWVAVGASVAGSLISGMSGKKSAKKAANAMKDMAAQNQNRIANATGQARSDLAPYIDTGSEAQLLLADLLGIGTRGYAPKPTRQDIANQVEHEHFQKYGGNYRRDTNLAGQQVIVDLRYKKALDDWEKGLQQYVQQNPNARGSGDLLKQFTGEDLENEPGYGFRLAEGEKGINRATSARGGYDSGATLKALARYNQDYASNEFGNAFNRDASTKSRIYNFLSGTAGSGQNAATTQANMSLGAATTQSSNAANAANAAANYQVQGADAMNAGIQGAIGNAIYGYERNRGIVGNTRSDPLDYGYSTSRPWYSME